MIIIIILRKSASSFILIVYILLRNSGIRDLALSHGDQRESGEPFPTMCPYLQRGWICPVVFKNEKVISFTRLMRASQVDIEDEAW